MFPNGEPACSIEYRLGDCGFDSPGKARTCSRFESSTEEGTARRRTIFICIQATTSFSDVRGLLAHELIHAKQLCLQKDDSESLTGDCPTLEKAAYAVSCAAALKQECLSKDAKDYDRRLQACITIGINQSCVELPKEVNKNNKTCDNVINDVFRPTKK